MSHGQVNILSDKLQWEEFEKAFLVIERYFMYSKIKFNNQEINDKEEILMLKTSIIDPLIFDFSLDMQMLLF